MPAKYRRLAQSALITTASCRLFTVYGRSFRIVCRRAACTGQPRFPCDMIGAKEKQATAQQAFVFPAPTTRKGLTKSNRECNANEVRIQHVLSSLHERHKGKTSDCAAGICFSSTNNEKGFDEVKQRVQCERSSHSARVEKRIL